MREYHLQLEPGAIGGYVLLPGDPGRCQLIASHLDDARHVASNREFTTWTGRLDGEPVSVVSTGIGGPSTAIAVEELCNVGAHTLLRVGSAGAMQHELRIGDLVIVQAAVRADGTSRRYAPVEVPAVAHIDVLEALRGAARASGRRSHTGTVSSNDAFYPELEPGRMPQSDRLRQDWEALRRCQVLAAEMECASLFIAAITRCARVGAVVGVVNEAGSTEEPLPDVKALPMEATIATAVEAIRLLIRRDGERVGDPGDRRSPAGVAAVGD